jgi:hypothetical protein
MEQPWPQGLDDFKSQVKTWRREVELNRKESNV